MKLCDFQGEEALEVLGELIIPASKIFGDKEVFNSFANNKPKLIIAQYVLKNYKSNLLEILAILNKSSVEDYKNKNMVGIIADVVELFTDKELVDFFVSQANQN